MSGELLVQYSKLPEWLLARRAIPENYAALLLGINAKVAEALREPVSDQVARGIIAEHNDEVSYFVARDIYEAVAKSPEGQAKTLLGGHTHPGVAKWKAVLDAYKRRHLGWAREARTLIQNVSYEIPALKRHVAACEKQVSECTQRQTELVRIQANAKARYEALLRDLGIEGFDPRRELFAHAAATLPGLHAELVGLLRSSGGELLEYYRAFAEHVTGGTGEKCEGLLALLAAVMSMGEDARVEDLEREVPALQAARLEAAGQTKPIDVEVHHSEASKVELVEGQSSTGIDWGDFGGGGDAAMHGGDDSNGIKWDFELTEGGHADETDCVVESTSGGIDWSAISFEGLELRAEGDEEKQEEHPHSDELLTDRQTRELLYQEVAELGAFLKERCADLSCGTSTDYGPKHAQKSLQEVKALTDVTNRAEELLAGRATQRLVLLQSSDRYLDQHVKRIERAKVQCEKPVTQSATLDKVKADAAGEAKRARAEIDKLRSVTRKIQKELEAELSAHFKTQVRIVGDISQI